MCGLVRRQPALQLTGLRHTPVLDAGICYVHDGDVGGCRPRNPQEEKQQYPRRPDATRSAFEVRSPPQFQTDGSTYPKLTIHKI
ncbi:MAG: hypothetical protein QOF99_153 [Pseudonocardiales bacterium]|nr:hypothetical protein [Pseudonocardiales bacterium]